MPLSTCLLPPHHPRIQPTVAPAQQPQPPQPPQPQPEYNISWSPSPPAPQGMDISPVLNRSPKELIFLAQLGKPSPLPPGGKAPACRCMTGDATAHQQPGPPVVCVPTLGHSPKGSCLAAGRLFFLLCPTGRLISFFYFSFRCFFRLLAGWRISTLLMVRMYRLQPSPTWQRRSGLAMVLHVTSAGGPRPVATLPSTG